MEQMDQWLLDSLRCPICGNDGLFYRNAGKRHETRMYKKRDAALKRRKRERAYPIFFGVADMLVEPA